MLFLIWRDHAILILVCGKYPMRRERFNRERAGNPDPFLVLIRLIKEKFGISP
jgi:hypothetical protein